MPPRGGKRKSTLRRKIKRSVRVPPIESSPLPPAEPDDQGYSHSVWLDALPPDICVRIAAYITRDQDSGKPKFLNEVALALSKTSSKQRSSVAEALDHTPNLHDGDIKPWLDVFQHPVSIDAREGRGNAVLQLLSSSSLRVAHISNRGNHLTAIAQGNSVAVLSIHLERLTDSRYTSMLEMLQKLTHLVSLSILCDPLQTCAFEYMIASGNAYKRLARACPLLTALNMCCHCRTEVDHSPVVEAFPALRELTVAKPLPESALGYMRSRDSVTLQSDSKSICRYASEIGAAVTGIKFPEPKWSHSDAGQILNGMDFVSKEEAALLKNCQRLRELDLLLFPGAENGLPEMKLLLSLRLLWSINIRGYEESAWLGKPLDGSLIRRVCAQPLLQQLVLVGAPVRMEDLVVVLRAAGNSLEDLTTSLTGQPDMATVRLLGIMDHVMLYNHKLGTLRVAEPPWMEDSEISKCLSGLGSKEKKQFLPEFRIRVCRLQRKNPWFNSATLLLTTAHIVEQCEEAADI